MGKKLGTKTRERTFALKVHVPLYEELVWDVIDSLEKDRLAVFSPHDADAMKQFERSGAEELDGRASEIVSIREWLCVACQYIVTDDHAGPRDRTASDVLAAYRNNACEVIFPRHGGMPLGPGAFVGGIALFAERMLATNRGEDAFRCVVAHELVHVFDLMTLLVPAYMDWPAFWKNVLHEGSCCDDAAAKVGGMSTFIDDYGGTNELQRLKAFWPSDADRWFKAMRGAAPRAASGKMSRATRQRGGIGSAAKRSGKTRR